MDLNGCHSVRVVICRYTTGCKKTDLHILRNPYPNNYVIYLCNGHVCHV